MGFVISLVSLSPAANGSGESDLEHPFDNACRMVADFMIGKRPRADDAHEFPGAALISRSGSGVVADPDIDKASIYLHGNLSSYLSHSSATTPRSLTLLDPPQSSSSSDDSARRSAAVKERRGRLTKARCTGRSLNMIRTNAYTANSTK
jgi:hypothetical protein